MQAELHLRSTIREQLKTGAMPCPQVSLPDGDVSGQLLIAELQHRIRNILSVVQCFLANTEAETAHDYRRSVEARIESLSSAYDLIESGQQRRISFAKLLERTLRPHATRAYERIILAGPDIALQPRCALSLHLFFHELATNACKHGALASPAGSVEVHWDILATPGRRALAIQWRERGGPEVTKPQRKGFGMRMIAKIFPEAQIDIDFAPSGLVVRLLLEAESWSCE